MMTIRQIALVRESFATLAPIAPEAAAIFYRNLFALDPKLKPKFRGDMEAQGAALMNMIAWAVGRLERAEELLPALRELGARHGRYGVRSEHYATVGAALVQTLAEGLGEAFTSEVGSAWIEMYDLISATMMAGAAHEALAA
ncbi:globin domain-containing protein [Caldimonas sp. KR1-144]|uniref:globin domain-containing protein n=1 Tax=Caldimonas sp. KR1-144 TaxID=3400911 RepID=UPI003C0E868C